MRVLIRLLVLWAIGLPLFYFAILPRLMDRLDEKARRQNLAACLAQFEGLSIKPGAIDDYCHCLTDGLTFTTRDLTDMVRSKPPTQMSASVKAASDTCNVILKTAL